MAYVRITLMRALDGHENEVDELNRELAEYSPAGRLPAERGDTGRGRLRPGRKG